MLWKAAKFGGAGWASATCDIPGTYALYVHPPTSDTVVGNKARKTSTRYLVILFHPCHSREKTQRNTRVNPLTAAKHILHYFQVIHRQTRGCTSKGSTSTDSSHKSRVVDYKILHTTRRRRHKQKRRPTTPAAVSRASTTSSA